MEARLPLGVWTGPRCTRVRDRQQICSHSLCGAYQECLSQEMDKGNLGLKSVRAKNLRDRNVSPDQE